MIIEKKQNNNYFGKVALLSDVVDSSRTQEILQALQKKQIDASLFEISSNNYCIKTHLIDCLYRQFSRVFIALPQSHYLSSGHIQGVLDLIGMDYTGSGVLASTLANDRIKVKQIWQKIGISTTPFVLWKPNINWQEVIGLIGFPVAVKSWYAYNQKVFKVMNMEQLLEACQNFWNFEEVIIEPWIVGEEYAVYIVGEEVMPPLYMNGFVSEAIKKEYYKNINVVGMQNLAIDAFKAIGGQGLGKVSIIRDLNNDFLVMSVNLSPLLAKDCHFVEAANNRGMSFETLAEKILATSLIKKNACQKLHSLKYADFK